VDAVPPPEPQASAYVFAAATDERPRTPHEVELCAKASHPDWLYFAGIAAADVGSIFLDTTLKLHGDAGARYLGAGAVGLSFGWTLGGGYLALPKCAPDWVGSAPPEGDVRRDLPMALAFAGLAGIVSPFVVGIETGPIPVEWPREERQWRLVIGGITGITGALLPYLLPPQTWSAAKELEHLRAGPTPDGRGATVSWSVRF
jgi:hypothetical protein